jgi:hypothetical protein
VDGFELFGGIFARILEDDLGAAGVLCREKWLTQCQFWQCVRCVPGKNSVTSYAFPCTITQHDSLELCFAISSPVRLPTSGFSLSGRFMVTTSGEGLWGGGGG